MLKLTFANILPRIKPYKNIAEMEKLRILRNHIKKYKSKF